MFITSVFASVFLKTSRLVTLPCSYVRFRTLSVVSNENFISITVYSQIRKSPTSNPVTTESVYEAIWTPPTNKPKEVLELVFIAQRLRDFSQGLVAAKAFR